MAELDIAPSFGAELKVTLGIAWLDEIQQFYRERAAIEKEYAGKLKTLAQKYFEKKAKKTSALSVGENPVVTPGSLERCAYLSLGIELVRRRLLTPYNSRSASMTTWGVQLTTLERRAAEHDQFASQLLSSLVEPLKYNATRYEELRKQHVEYAGKLEKERDGSYADLKKMKGKYDSVCQEVENRRKKIEGSFDYGKQKAQVAYQQQMGEMRNVKNTYILSINVTNRQKDRYYHEYVPELLDLNSLWLLGAQIEKDSLERSAGYLGHLASEIPRNNPSLDSMMFVRHNAGDWVEPADMRFEPSPVWLDEGTIAADEAAKTYLRNILLKSKGQLREFTKQVEDRRRQVNNARAARKNIREGRDKRDEVEVQKAIFALQESLHELERQKITAEVEIQTITAAVGDVSLGARNHNFKSQTFKIPTNCDLCGERIWGLSAKGFDCLDCGYTCHSKCEMKVPADCPGEMSKEDKKKLKTERQSAAHAAPAASLNGAASESSSDLPRISRSDTVNSMNTLSSGYSATPARRSPSGLSSPTEEAPPPTPGGMSAATPTPGASKPGTLRKNRIVAPPPAQYIKAPPEPPVADAADADGQRAKMLYPYQASGEGEISVDDGRDVTILEPDDGSGWAKVRVGALEGLVPASYLEVLPHAPTAASSIPRPQSTHSASSVSVTGSIGASAAAAAAAAGPHGGKKKGPAVAPKRGAKKLKYAEAMYDYDARSEAEHSMREGERFVLINKNAGEGWADVEKDGTVKSVPANYIQEV
ncbi:hypothetical protein BDY21DRAFT_8336 [Lineolata rhizophorae]|uniref:Protein BZZ1 n=1 Tax=Lineolata rhizophorae TaxID=578093 RepID=A0A6A6PDU0_9PEZI|nr:hypothetical protein BDY21DRAFT_8336 [Lineolata rhizophorae]